MKKRLVKIASASAAAAAMMLLAVGVSADTPVKYKLNIKTNASEQTSVTVTSDNMNNVLEETNDDGTPTVVYTPATDTEPAVLTITDANLKYIQQQEGNDDLRIVFIGETNFYVGEDEWAFCISMGGNLEISGDGSVTLVNDFYNPEDEYGNYGYPCIMSEKNITIKSVEVEATSKAGTNPIYCIGNMLICDGAKVTSNADDYPALWSAGNMTIENAEVTAKSKGTGIWADGDIIIKGRSEVEVTAGTDYYGIGTYNSLTIQGDAEVTVKSSAIGLYAGYNEDYTNNNNDIVISENADVNITSTWALWSKGGNVIISGGNIETPGSKYAMLNKPDLSGFKNPLVYAGSSAEDAVLVENPETSDYYKTNQYIRIVEGYTVTVTAENGTASASAEIAPAGDTITLTAQPADGYQFKEWQVSDEVVTVTDNQFVMPASDVEITAVFELLPADGSDTPGGNTPGNNFSSDISARWRASVMMMLSRKYDIAAAAGEGGTITPKGISGVRYDSSFTYKITADEGYEVTDVLVDGKSVGAVSEYTFKRVKENHTIEVIFGEIK